jgi:glycosyltransferase involved in cell wall biosynthesis
MRISVVIPTFNGEAWIGQAIDSVLEQSYRAQEIIVIDDGSTDSTAAVVRSRGPAVRLIQQAKSGTATARNRGITESAGDWIALLDHDDYFLPVKFERLRRLLESDSMAVAAYSGFLILRPDGTMTEVPGFPAEKLWPAVRYCSPIQPSALLVRKSALNEIGGFDTAVRMVSDWDLNFRLTRRFSPTRIRSTPEPLAVYRVWAGNMSSNHLGLLAESLLLLDRVLLTGTSGFERNLWRRRICSRLLFETALELRHNGQQDFLHMALRSVACWPFFGQVVPAYRYKVLVHMMYSHLLRDARQDK